MTDPAPSAPVSTGTSENSRREFLRSSTLLAGGVAAASLSTLSPAVYASGSDVLKVGLVGCGGRGTGAASNALHADARTELYAVADAFKGEGEQALAGLKNQQKIAGQVKVAPERVFVGLDAYKQVIECCDVVVLASPPGFRPVHLRAAIEAGRHIFTEKPMATDAPGARSIFESVELSKKKNIAMVAGYCWRYDYAKRALFEKVHAGEIGDVRAVYGTYLTSPVKPMPAASTRPAGMTDLEWQVRNWYNFTWLSGDGLVEQAIHTVDWVAWAFQDNPAASATAVGGRQIPSEGGDIYDHIEVNYVWANDARGFLSQRQIPGCFNENLLYILGTKGTAKISPRGSVISDLSGEQKWRYDGPTPNMYQVEHDEFFASIRSGKHINDGDRMAKSTLMGIMGRMAGYTGQQITWEMAMNSQQNLTPVIDNGWESKAEFRSIPKPGYDRYA